MNQKSLPSDERGLLMMPQSAVTVMRQESVLRSFQLPSAAITAPPPTSSSSNNAIAQLTAAGGGGVASATNPQDILQELLDVSVLTESNATIEQVQSAITLLYGRQKALVRLLQSCDIDLHSSKDTSMVLDEVVEEVARLMEVASKLNKQQLGSELRQSFDALGPPELNPDEIKFDLDKDLIGSGSYGKVYRGMCRGLKVAVKVPSKQELTDIELEAFRREVQIMRKVFHPNVVLCLGGCCTRRDKVMIITELLRGGDVETLIHPNLASSSGSSSSSSTSSSSTVANAKPPSLLKKLKILHDAALGINWLHGICGIVHRDLKPANLLLDEQGHCKVSDFGFSEILKGGRRLKDIDGVRGSYLYLAPEVMQMREFDHSADIHSFGLILYEVTTGIEPYQQYESKNDFAFAVVMKKERPVVPSTCNIPASLVRLMQQCWDPNPKQRPTMPQVVSALEEIIIEKAINAGPEPRSYWLSHWKTALLDAVPWHDFATQVSQDLGIPDSLMLSPGMERLFLGVNGSAAGITPSRYNQMCLWFSNWFLPVNRDTVFEEILMLASPTESPYFFGDISLEEAVGRLNKRSHGTFMVRMSFTEPKAPFTLSFVSLGQCEHKRIFRKGFDDKHMADRYAIQVRPRMAEITAPSLPQLLKKLAAAGTITIPCPRDTPPGTIY